jgi:hypothetical protein
MSEVDQGPELLNKLSQALIAVSRGDPIISLRSELQAKFESIDSRFAGFETSTKLQHDDLVRVPTQVDRAIEGLDDLLTGRLAAAEAKIEGKLTTINAELNGRIDTAVAELKGAIAITRAEALEKFAGINNQFAQGDKALTAALQAQEKQAIATNDNNTAASTKMEAGFTKIIEQQTSILTEVRRNYDAQFTEVKSRLDKREGVSSVADPQLASAFAGLSNNMTIMQTEVTRAFTKMSDANVAAISELKVDLRKIERTEASGKDRSMGRGEIVSYIMMSVLVLSQIVVMFTVFAPSHVVH